MLIKLKARIPEIFFGMFLAVAIFAMGVAFESSRNHLSNQTSQSAATQIQNNSKPEPFSWDWLMQDGTVFFTSVLCFIAGIQATLFIWQLRYMQKGMEDARLVAKATDLNARAAIALELPIIRANAGKFGCGGMVQGRERQNEVWVGSMFFANLGKTRAFPIEVQIGLTVGDSLPDVPVYTFKKLFAVNATLGDQESEISLTEFAFEVVPDIYEHLRTKSVNLWFYCNLVYLDFMQTRHDAGFCWKRHETIGMGTLRPDPTPAYNRKT